ncbi:hypothetical protein MMC07_008321 [Pseudocyphellaria aurata]|nr:hypothetical protein [Pseudocyphellaria aurata]
MALASRIALSADVAVKVSTEAAQKLVDSYYPALQSKSDALASFYMVAKVLPDGTSLPSIILNGNVIPSPAEMQSIFQNEMPAARYEVQSFDCQVINPNFIPENSKSTVSSSGKNMIILVVVSGYVKYGESRDVPTKCFSENFVLVPNPDLEQARNKGKHVKDWLIQSQNFRLVV